MSERPTPASATPVAPPFDPSPSEMLYRFAQGYLIIFLNDEGGPIGWRKYSHRGLQFLDKIHIGDRQKKDIFAAKFTIRYDTAFERVMRACADRGEQRTWITEPLIKRYLQLHHMGFAHSFECWQAGENGGREQLVGGCFGLQLGSLMTAESMFHTAPNGGKAAYVRTLLHLRERGFKVVDVNNAHEFAARFGAENVPQWKFEEVLRECLPERPTFLDGLPAPAMPLGVRVALPLARVARKMGKVFQRRAVA